MYSFNIIEINYKTIYEIKSKSGSIFKLIIDIDNDKSFIIDNNKSFVIEDINNQIENIKYHLKNYIKLNKKTIINNYYYLSKRLYLILNYIYDKENINEINYEKLKTESLNYYKYNQHKNLQIDDWFRFNAKRKIHVYNEKEINYIHNNLINILKKLLILLKEFNIIYWITSGTLLGCIREQRIIKHDDDIDICILKKDFFKLQNKEVFIKAKELGIKFTQLNKNYNALNAELIREDNNHNFMCVDIFPYENINQKYDYIFENYRKLYPNEYYYHEELFPLKKGKLNELEVNIPNKSLEIVKRMFGNDWSIPKITHNHYYGINLKM